MATPVTLVDENGKGFGRTAGVAIASGGITASANFTPVPAAYLAGDCVGATQEFVFTYADGSPVPAGSLIRIDTTVLKIGRAALISGEGAYTLQNYSVTPPSAQVDNDAWTLALGDLTAYRGPLDLSTPVDKGAALYVKNELSDQRYINLTGVSMFSKCVTVGAQTMTAEPLGVFLYGFVL